MEPKNRMFGRKLSISYIKNNLVSFNFLLTFLLINAGLIAVRWFHTYAGFSYYVKIAKSCGQCLNFTCAFTLFLVLRKCITVLRSYGCSRFLPLDQSIYYHKMIGYFITVYATLHTINHAFHFNDVSKLTNVTASDYLFTVRENTWPRQYTPVLGWALLSILLVMVLTSLPVVRRTGNFEIFYYSHTLYVPFYVLLILHAPAFIYWFSIPGILFVIEAISRIRNSLGSRGRTYIEKGVILPSRVIHLVIRRPPNFEFSPGDWVFVQIPGVAKTEWHPFTISSAPEMTDVLWLHIRSVGEWTNRVYDYFQVEEDKMKQLESIDGSKKSRLSFELPIKRGKSFPPSSSTPQASAIVGHSPNLSPIRPNDDQNNNNNNNDNVNGEECCEINGDNNNIYDPHKNPFFHSNELRRGIKHSNLDRMVSTPIPRHNFTKPPFGRTLSTIEPLMKIPFDRRTSKIYVLPRPRILDLARKRKSFLPSRSVGSKNPNGLETVAEEIEAQSITSGESSGLDLAELIHDNSDSPHTLLQSGRVIKLEKPLFLHLDGPYGSPTSHIFHTEHAILIGTGIGITPFASILQSIMYRFLKTRHTCPQCSHVWSEAMPCNVMKLKKVDFVWINRNQRSFEWFVSLLSQLESHQAMLSEAERFLDIHMYITSVPNSSGMAEIALKSSTRLMHEDRDLITGLKTRTHTGRPDWNIFFKDISQRKKGRVTVFFCGAPELGRTIQGHCIPFGFGFRKENF